MTTYQSTPEQREIVLNAAVQYPIPNLTVVYHALADNGILIPDIRNRQGPGLLLYWDLRRIWKDLGYLAHGLEAIPHLEMASEAFYSN